MTQEEQEEVKLLKELIADKSISADEREIYEDALNQLMKSEKPKPTTSTSKPTTTQRKTRTAPTKKVAPAKGKKSVDDVEKAKAEIKAKTGKTEAECESIIEQYRALRTKAQEGKRKAEQASADNKERVDKLERKGDIIAGTNEKTADAVIESTAKDVADKIEKEVEAIEAKAEKEAKAEVAKDNSIKNAKDKKEAIDAIVDEKVKANTKPIVKRIVIDTSALLTSIATSLGKFDKDSQKEFLIKLRSDIDKLLSKYSAGGITDGAVQVMNVQQSNMSSSSVNPSHFGNGGGVGDIEEGDMVFVPSEDRKAEVLNIGKSGVTIMYAHSKERATLGLNEIEKLNQYAKGGGVGERKVFEAQEDGILGVYSGSDAYSIEISKGDRFATFGKQDNGNWWFVKKIDIKPTSMMLENTFDYNESKSNVPLEIWQDLVLTFPKGDKSIYAEMKEVFANGGGVGEYNKSWHQDHYRHNKGESYEVPVGSRKHKYSVGGTLLSGMVGAYVGYQYGKKGKKAFKFEDGGMVGQEIVFDYQGEEKTGVIKDVHNSGDYIVSTDDGRTLLAQRDRDVISLGKMREKSPMMDAPRKRFGFFGEGGGVDNPSRQEMLDYLNMYFDYYSELRTIAVEEDNILTRRMLKSLDDEELEMAYEDAQYEIKADTQYSDGGGVDDYIDEQEMEFANDRSKMRKQYGRENIKNIEYQGFLAIDENDERLSDYDFEGEEFDRDNLLEVAKTYPQAKYIVFHARLMGESDFGIEDELSPIDDLAMEFDMDKLNQFAKGGLTEHGLREGDKIVFDHLVDDNIDIIDRNGVKHIIDLDKGKRFGNGGGVKDKIKVRGFAPISKEEAILLNEDFKDNFNSNIERFTKHLNKVHNSKLRVSDTQSVIDFASQKPTQSQLNNMTAFNLMEAMKNDKQNYGLYKKALLKLYPDAKGFASGGEIM